MSSVKYAGDPTDYAPRRRRTMCGIAGIWGQIATARVDHMLELLAHRGSYASGLCTAPAAPGLVGYRWLSIIGPLAGDQPIYSPDQPQAIIANGEIYNFPQLQPWLAQRPHFRTSSDSEAILHLYVEYGMAVVE